MNGIRREGGRLGALVLVGAVAAVVAVALFQVPLATVFTFGVLLICPLMMFGMHGSHDHARHTHGHETGDVDRGSHEHASGR